jgi:DNA-binding SARP family transcriptional activator
LNRGIVPQSVSGLRWFRAALSVVSLVLIVIAVPVALYLAGGLPLSHLPYGHVSQAVTSAHSDDRQLVAHWLSRGALLLAWVAWAWMTVCVVRELKAWADGRSSTPLPASRTMQSIAACLVGTALAMSTGGRQAYMPGMARSVSVGSTLSAPSAPSAAGQPIRVLADVASLFDTGFGATPSSSAVGPADLSPSPEEQLDMPWSKEHVEVLPVSERTDESVAPDPGTAAEVRASTAVSYSEPARNHLQINAPVPPDARPTEAGPADTEGAPSITVHLVASRETLWSIATDKLGSALRWKEIAELNYQVRQPDGKSLDLTHWIRPGWRLILPAPEGADGSGVAALNRQAEASWSMPDGGLWGGGDGDESMYSGTDATAETAPELATANHRAHVAAVDPSPPLTPMGGPRVPSAPLGAGVMGAGVVNILDRMRRVQQRHRRGGMFIELPDHSQQAFEQRVRLSDGEEITAEVDGSLRLFTRVRTAAGREVPIVTGVKVQPGAIEITVEEPGGRPFDGELPDEFRLLADGHTLAVDRLALREIIGTSSEARSLRSPAPLMATVGQGPDGLVMVNLESLGSVLVSGRPEACDGMVRALALELATSHWADQFDLLLVGFGAELERFSRVTSHIDVPALINRLCRRSIDGEAVLRSTGFSSFFQARCVENSSVWDPLVVLCGPGVGQEDLLELLEVVGRPHTGTAIVAVGEQTGDTRMVTLPDSTPGSSLELLASVVYPQQIAIEELSRVTALLDTASTRESVPFDAEPYVSLSIALPDSRVADRITERGDTADGSGPVDPVVDRGKNPIARDAGPVARATELDAEASHPAVQGWNQSGSATSWSTSSVSSVTGDTVAVRDRATDQAPEMDVEVAVLGPVEIRGAARPFTRAWAKELVVYLAMHPNGASNEAWVTALWPDRIMAPSSLHSTASVARRSLGQSADGRDHLPRSHGRLALADSVGSDWTRFVALADSPDVANWRLAVEMVRGRPFEGLRSSDWTVLEGIGPAIEAAVVDISGRLAGAYLAAGDARGAEWSARKGLLVSPYDERLYRMLMRSSDLAGNPAGVEAVMAELVRLVADDIEPFDSVHPSTMDLYRSLTRRRTTAAGTVTSRADR